jgi:hypothetical protein
MGQDAVEGHLDGMVLAVLGLRGRNPRDMRDHDRTAIAATT